MIIKNLPIFAFIGLRYAATSNRHSFVAFINLFSVAGIALGIAALITVVSVMNGLEGQLKQRILGILPHMVLEQAQTPSLSEQNSQKILASVPFVEQEVIAQSRSKLNGLYMQGIDIEREAALSIVADNMVAGQWQSIRSGSFNVIISRALASQMRVNLGESLRLISTQALMFTPLGPIPSQRLVRVSGIFDVGSQMDDKVLLMHIDDVAKLSRKRTSAIVNTRLFLKDAFDYQSVEAELRAQKVALSTWRERQGPLFDAVKMEKNMMSLMLLLIIAVAAFNIVSALVMVVNEKTADIAILLTQGMSSAKIMWIFVLNGLINGIKGIAAGLILGLVLVSQLNNVLAWMGAGLAFGPNGTSLPIDLQYLQVFYISGASLLLCLLATIYPAKRAASISPAHSLQSE